MEIQHTPYHREIIAGQPAPVVPAPVEVKPAAVPQETPEAAAARAAQAVHEAAQKQAKLDAEAVAAQKQAKLDAEAKPKEGLQVEVQQSGPVIDAANEAAAESVGEQ